MADGSAAWGLLQPSRWELESSLSLLSRLLRLSHQELSGLLLSSLLLKKLLDLRRSLSTSLLLLSSLHLDLQLHLHLHRLLRRCC